MKEHIINMFCNMFHISIQADHPVQAIPLKRAVLCVNEKCETIFDVAVRTCPQCGGKEYLSVAVALSDEKTKRIYRMRLRRWAYES